MIPAYKPLVFADGGGEKMQSMLNAQSAQAISFRFRRERLKMGISKQEALELFESDDLIGIGMMANEVRRKKTDPRVATYQIDRNINYTNFCTEYCSFCAFYRPLGAKDGYILPLEDIYARIDEMLELGGNGVLMQGGAAPGFADRVLREHVELDQGEVSAGAFALLFGAGN